MRLGGVEKEITHLQSVRGEAGDGVDEFLEVPAPIGNRLVRVCGSNANGERGVGGHELQEGAVRRHAFLDVLHFKAVPLKLARDAKEEFAPAGVRCIPGSADASCTSESQGEDQ